MAEDNRERTPEEIAADVRLAEAEAAKAEAEAEKARAEAGRHKVLAKKASLEVAELQMTHDKHQREHDRMMASDEENHVYRCDGEVSKSSISTCLKKLTQWSRCDPGCDIEIVISSGGGGIIPGFELFDFIQDLRNKGHTITTGSLGMAASMAGILLQAGSVRWLGHQSWMMIHRAAFGAFGKTYEVEDEVEFVKRIEARILDIFTARSDLTTRKIKRNWDRKDWWISSDQALKLGLIDEVRATMPEVSGTPLK